MLFCNSCTQRIFQSFWTGWNWSFILLFTFRHHHHHHHHHHQRHHHHHHHHLHLLLVIQILVAAIPPWVTKRDLMCRVRVGLSQFKFFFLTVFFLTTFVFLAVFVGFLLSCLLFFPCSARFCHPASVVLATDKKQQFNPKWFSSPPLPGEEIIYWTETKERHILQNSYVFNPEMVSGQFRFKQRPEYFTS